MNIIVTGAGGNVGRFLANYLAKLDHRVTGIVRHHIPTDNNFSIFVADISKDIIDMSNIDCVIHVAAAIRGDTRTMIRDNIVATDKLVKMSERYGVKKFYYMSSVSAHGIVKGDLSVESDIINPGVYGASKYIAEQVVLESNITEKIVFKLPRMLGPFVDLKQTDSGIINMIKGILDNEDIVCNIPDVAYNNFMHVLDLCSFVNKFINGNLMEEDSLVIPLGAKTKQTMRYILETLKTASNSKSNIEYIKDNNVPACATIDISKAIEWGYDPMEVSALLRLFMREILE